MGRRQHAPQHGNNNNGALTITFDGDVGNATADESNSPAAFGPALTALVAVNGSYANLESTATAVSGSGGYNLIGSTATILAGTNSGGSVRTVSMAWRTQTQTERTGADLISDVVDLSGIAVSGTSGQTAPFVLQLDYRLVLLPDGPGTESMMAAAQEIYLEWLDPKTGVWTNAIDRDTGTTSSSFCIGAWPSGDTTLGDWGVNSASQTVWAVVDYNSEFAAGIATAPQPSTLILLGAPSLGLLVIAWQARDSRRDLARESW